MLDAQALRAGLQRWYDALEAAAPELNELDARLGDGDLGTTLQRSAANVREVLPGLPDTLPGLFKGCAGASAKASGSSFGTLLAQAFLTAARETADAQAIDRAGLVHLLDAIVATLSSRGGAALGDKTMLDSLDMIARSLAEASDATDLRPVARAAAARAVDTLRDRPNRIGRARMFAERSIGLEDPGMVAILRMAEAL
jgi:phosphoenolpyruvate---glycerone phosphotransferase subunit DhaL